MKIIEKAKMPDGTDIQLEDWTEHNSNGSNVYGFEIGAYPVAKNTSDSTLIRSGDLFRLTISQNEFSNYTNEDVKADYEALKSGKKYLADLSEHFWNGKKDEYLLGMI